MRWRISKAFLSALSLACPERTPERLLLKGKFIVFCLTNEGGAAADPFVASFLDDTIDASLLGVKSYWHLSVFHGSPQQVTARRLYDDSSRIEPQLAANEIKVKATLWHV